MSLFRKAKRLVDNHGDKIAKGVDKATDKIDEKTGGKHRDKLDKIDDAAKKLDRHSSDPLADIPDERHDDRPDDPNPDAPRAIP